MAQTHIELPTIECTTMAEFEDWLEAHHADSPGVWIKLARTDAESDALTFEEALQSTLCYGWFMGVRRNLDNDHYLQKFVPEAPDREWAWIECDTAEWLIDEQRMRPAGLEMVEAAKATDRWEQAYASRGALPVPDLLRARLASFPEAKTFFESLNERERNAIVYRLQGLVDRETYMRRVDEIVARLKQGEKPYDARGNPV